MQMSVTISATDNPFFTALATLATFSASRPAGRLRWLPCYLAKEMAARLFSRLFSRSY
jgi:hypothetical protein